MLHDVTHVTHVTDASAWIHRWRNSALVTHKRTDSKQSAMPSKLTVFLSLTCSAIRSERG